MSWRNWQKQSKKSSHCQTSSELKCSTSMEECWHDTTQHNRSAQERLRTSKSEFQLSNSLLTKNIVITTMFDKESTTINKITTVTKIGISFGWRIKVLSLVVSLFGGVFYAPYLYYSGLFLNRLLQFISIHDTVQAWNCFNASFTFTLAHTGNLY